MDAIAFEHHLTSPQGHRRSPAGVHGDRRRRRLLRPDRALAQRRGRPRHRRRVRRPRLRRRDRRRERRGHARRGAARCSRRRGSGPSRSRTSSAVSARASCTPPSSPPTRSRGRSAPPCANARVVTDAPSRRDRGTLVAMSGGVDSAVAALLCAREGETVAVTLELWSDPENDAERSCCSASAVAQARALAHSMGLPHFTIDLRDEFRAGVVEPFIAALRRRGDPQPVRRLQRPRPPRRDARPRRAPRLRDGSPPAITRGSPSPTTQPGRCCASPPTPPRIRRTCSRRSSPSSLARMRFPLGELTKPEVRRIAADAGLPVASKADSQDLCFLAGTDRARFLARHGGLGDAPGALVDPGRHGRRPPPRPAPVHGRASGAGSGLAAPGEPLYVLDKDAATQRGRSSARGRRSRPRACLSAALG